MNRICREKELKRRSLLELMGSKRLKLLSLSLSLLLKNSLAWTLLSHPYALIPSFLSLSMISWKVTRVVGKSMENGNINRLMDVIRLLNSLVLSRMNR